MAPINGISLEQYAELGAAVTDHVNDQAKVIEIVTSRGIRQEDWDAAVAGWTARMQDPSLMGAVATAYMPMYQAALARKAQAGDGKPAPDVTFEDYVAMSGLAKVMGVPGMCGHYGIDDSQWTQIAMGWNTKIPTDPRYMGFGMQVEQEGARIQGGGPPRPVSFAAGPPAPQPAPAAPPTPTPPPPAMPAQGPGIEAGAPVLVQWSDGNRYPATVTQVSQDQCHVTFNDGRQEWVPAQFLDKAE